ncbi:RNA polymerase sigma factor [Pedobacter psychrodurus]|uniref:RNA polymerase sigma factor n=1 Tax=Pedobacter psychrodurus TaxID=2530456 RepID=UPI00292FC476|nr:sigma-70 family RNA polymerase sigma factor [Pedobacter psychrodurus]
MEEHPDLLHGSNLKPHWSLFIANGDGDAFKKIYLHYYHYFSFISLKKGFSSSKTNDVFNELFLYIWENQGKLTHIHDHHNYLVTAFLRKLYKRKKYDLDDYVLNDDFPDLVVTNSVEADYIAKGTQQDVSRILNSFLDKLPQRQKSLIYQKFYLGLSYKEIALANNISINTVYNTIYNAVDKLKELMGKEQVKLLSLALLILSAFFYFFFVKQ